MDALASSEVFLFEDFRLDRHGGGLFRRDDCGVFVPVAIGSRALDLLSVLITRAGEVVSKDEIVAAVWPKVIVEDSNLTVQISALRRMIDHGRSGGSYIQTVPGRGYRFVAPVTRFVGEVRSVKSVMDRGEVHAADSAAEPVTALPMSRQPIAVSRRRRTVEGAIVAALAAMLVLSVIVWWFWPTAKVDQTSETAAADPIRQPPVAPRLSIVVLPFANLSNDADQQYFADGITEDLTTDLSQIPDMFVISRNTAFTYRNKPVDTKQIGRDLGVRYVLEGSVQRLRAQVRVRTQLVDAETDAHLWAERFDHDVSDLFAIQNEITSRIAIALNLEVTIREAARPTANPDALDYILRGRAAYHRPATRENYTEIIRLFEQALALDPRSAEAQSRLAGTLVDRVLDEMSESGASDIARAEGLIRQALAASPRSPLAHFVRAQLLRATDRCEEAITEYQAVLASDRNSVASIAHIGRCKIYVGPIEEAIPLQEQAIRLSPREPNLGLWYFRIGQAHLLLSRMDEAIRSLEKARSASPTYPFVPRWLAAAYGLKGDFKRAAVDLAEARQLRGNGFPASIAQVKRLEDRYFVAPAIRAMYEATYLVGLRKAGVPEE
jgi:adenylate cyclase